MSAKVRAEKIKLLILDVDGVLTDGGLYYDKDGNVTKRFNVQDGLGIKFAQQAGIELAVITGLNHGAVEKRVTELGITEYYPGQKEKLPFYEKLLKEKGLKDEEVAYVGDDWIDVPVMLRVGLPMAVKNAQPEIFGISKWISNRDGGHGAVREAISFILDAQGKLNDIWKEWAG
ncbi:KdsC family phosphatase [Maridesulfovibrio salexigens]|uniref:3-deoxy-D-manno-octulosonate 8-phosphate phosphatase KdsC n=1 Tax=Maridesulfovibrio salexigens (strain ATCC 14822 / DSM 2638 / NCIMB 8403 / VKM B-1763) TaxID=526222 RepID=C6BWN5_MARSD|nr:HAD-IIIA family hydrolase [Maridesulfovibrio salexigens]ACS80315.1 3-deoxy-D-manno-octulosonate 8-phosphate phosphatase, YrbI family [Maridesulfovibrio salexigens DSM 2638]